AGGVAADRAALEPDCAAVVEDAASVVDGCVGSNRALGHCDGAADEVVDAPAVETGGVLADRTPLERYRAAQDLDASAVEAGGIAVDPTLLQLHRAAVVV